MVALLKESSRSRSVKWFLILFCLSVAVYFALSEYLLLHRPHAMDMATGHTFPLQHHGSLAYVTRGEDRLLGIVAMAPSAFLICAMLLHARDLMRSRGP